MQSAGRGEEMFGKVVQQKIALSALEGGSPIRGSDGITRAEIDRKV